MSTTGQNTVAYTKDILYQHKDYTKDQDLMFDMMNGYTGMSGRDEDVRVSRMKMNMRCHRVRG